MNPSSRRLLEGRIKRLELLLRVSSGDRARDVEQALDALRRQIDPSAPPVSQGPGPSTFFADVAASAAGVNGIGGLAFEAQAPPGLGHLVALPLYLYDMDPQPAFPVVGSPASPAWETVATSNGSSVVDEVNPSVTVCIPPFASDGVTPNRSVKGLRFRTPILEWAKVRIVGFQVSTRSTPLPSRPGTLVATSAIAEGAPYGYTTSQRPTLLVKNLNVGGSANLFPQGEYVDATVYSSLLPEYAGLRDNPVLESPNRAYVTAAVTGVPFTSMTFSVQLVVDVLDDAEFGAHNPGPYARRGATARQPSSDGSTFVMR